MRPVRGVRGLSAGAPAAERATAATWLVGDVGATNARFGLVSPDGALLHSGTFAADDFAGIEAAIGAYLATSGDLPMPRLGALAIAAPISGDQIRMTNHPWSFSLAALRDRLGFERLVAINDFPRWRWRCRASRQATGWRSAAARPPRAGRSRCSARVRVSAFRA